MLSVEKDNSGIRYSIEISVVLRDDVGRYLENLLRKRLERSFFLQLCATIRVLTKDIRGDYLNAINKRAI